MPQKKKVKRSIMTKMYYPQKMGLAEFLKEIEIGIEPFRKNMEHLGYADEKYVEEWMKIYTDWMEMK